MATRKSIVQNGGEFEEAQAGDVVSVPALNAIPAEGDIASPNEGDIWYNSTLNNLRKNQNGVISDLDTTGSGNLLSGTADLQFAVSGLPEENQAVVTVLSALITNANIKTICFIPNITGTDHDSLDDFAVEGIEFNIENIVDGVSFDIRAKAPNDTWGLYKVDYFIGY